MRRDTEFYWTPATRRRPRFWALCLVVAGLGNGFMLIHSGRQLPQEHPSQAVDSHPSTGLVPAVVHNEPSSPAATLPAAQVMAPSAPLPSGVPQDTGHDQDIGKQDRGIEAKPPDRLQRDFGDKKRRVAKIEKPSGLNSQAPEQTPSRSAHAMRESTPEAATYATLRQELLRPIR